MAKNTKKKAPKDIAYRLIMAIMAVCVPIAAYFADYFYYVIQSDLFKLLAQLKGDTSDSGDTWGTFSLRTIVEEYLPTLRDGIGEGGFTAALEPLKLAAISFAVFFALALVLALVIFFFACFSKKKTVPICLSAGGILSMIGVYASFHYIAAPILDGTINLAEGTALASVLPYLASVSDLRLTTGFFLMLFLFLAMTLWAGANKIVEVGEKFEKGRNA